MIFKRGTDLLDGPADWCSERMRQVPGDHADMGRSAGDGAAPLGHQPLMKIGISSKKHSVIDLSMITYWTIRQRLMKCPAWPTWPCGASGLKCCRCKSIRSGWQSTASR